MPHYDVVVVGAGPAGLGACRQAAARGLKVALVERQQHLAPLKRACSEGLLYEEEYNGDAIRVNRQAGRIEFCKHGLHLAYTGPVREVPCFINLSRSGHQMKLVRDDRRPIHLVFDKARFLEENLAEVRAAGVAFFPGQAVSDLATRTDGVTLSAGTHDFTARFLIAADGHNSRCARLAGFDHQRQFYGTLSVACWIITGFDPPEPDHIHLVEGRDGPSVFCLCPGCHEGRYSVMVSGFAPNPRYQRTFDEVVRSSVLARHFSRRPRILRRMACVLNLFSPLANPCRDNVFIAGDAAWMGQTSNTHAALTGYMAAECIAEALRSRAGGDQVYARYRDWWQKNYACHIKPPGPNIFEELTASEVDALFACLPDQIEGSLEPRKGQQLMGALFQKLMPELQQRHPQLAQKIMAVQLGDPAQAWQAKRAMGFPGRKGQPCEPGPDVPVEAQPPGTSGPV